MTHDILQSDIELAARLVADHRPDDEIILALAHRGVDLGPAAQLVEELRKGIKPTSHSPLTLEFAMGRRSRSRRVSHGNEPAQPSRSSRAESPGEPPAPSAKQGQKRTAPFWLTIAIFVVLVVVVGSVILIQRYQASPNPPEEQTPKGAMPKVSEAPREVQAKAVVPGRNAPSPPLVLELQPDGLHLSGSLVNRGNLLTTAANLLGVPTRTNHVGQMGTVLYAYDHRGLLIYSQKGGGTNSIVLDCEGSGGTNGTTLPFAGSLKIEDHVIGQGTDSEALAAMKNLSLSRLSADSGIWSGQYNGLDLVFAYLTTSERLSRIEIDLK